MLKFPHFKQADQKDCGPTCLKIIAKYYGKSIHTAPLRDYAETTR
ncbi:cysteine peptidase family C39 domain-containing protein [Flavobacteriaceae bacterium F08102]|nr:cysteine peptidase family C39 domain-containing protein [Flavobacteriaceae bacterium F08102]